MSKHLLHFRVQAAVHEFCMTHIIAMNSVGLQNMGVVRELVVPKKEKKMERVMVRPSS